MHDVTRDRRAAEEAGTAAVALVLVLAALAPRVGPAVARYQPSNDAAEHLLIARALARGEGFTLPIRVRRPFEAGAEHDARAERAPLYPLLLSLPVRAGVGAAGWPDPRLQLGGCALAAIAALLAASTGRALARARGLSREAALWVALGTGLAVAWLPSFVRASIHLWAEPLGVVLALGAMRLDLALALAMRARASTSTSTSTSTSASTSTSTRGASLGLALALGVVAGLARFARPEQWALAVVVLALAALRWRDAGGEVRAARARELLALAGVIGVVNAIGIAWTGVLAPQLGLLAVAGFEELMDPGAAPAAPGVADVASGIAGNVLDLVRHALTPRQAYVLVPLALLALLPARGGRAPGPGRAPLAAAGALALAAAVVWSTSDPQRFALAPLALLAPVALVEAEARRRARLPGRAWPRALLLGGLVLVLGHHAGRELDARPPALPDPQVAREGAPRLADPWSYALVTGRPAVLAPR